MSKPDSRTSRKLIESNVSGSLGRGGRIVDDAWSVVESRAEVDVVPDDASLLVPHALWTTERERLIARTGPIGVLLEPADDPAVLVEDFARLTLIAIRFPKFTDGRGYSIARQLRERHGWRGPLRAEGEVLRDQLFYMLRCGFDSFSMKHEDQLEIGLSAYRDFSNAYQSAVDRPQPLFARRGATAATMRMAP